MVKKHIVDLSAEERASLVRFTTTGRHAADQITRARILLKADCNHPDGNWRDAERCFADTARVAAALDVGVATVERVRRRFVELGLEPALKRQAGGGRKPDCLNGAQEAHLVALVCGQPPEGQARWTLRLLADRMVKLGYTESVSHETVRQTLKKTSYNLGSKTVG